MLVSSPVVHAATCRMEKVGDHFVVLNARDQEVSDRYAHGFKLQDPRSQTDLFVVRQENFSTYAILRAAPSGRFEIASLGWTGVVADPNVGLVADRHLEQFVINPETGEPIGALENGELRYAPAASPKAREYRQERYGEYQLRRYTTGGAQLYDMEGDPLSPVFRAINVLHFARSRGPEEVLFVADKVDPSDRTTPPSWSVLSHRGSSFIPAQESFDAIQWNSSIGVLEGFRNGLPVRLISSGPGAGTPLVRDNRLDVDHLPQVILGNNRYALIRLEGSSDGVLTDGDGIICSRPFRMDTIQSLAFTDSDVTSPIPGIIVAVHGCGRLATPLPEGGVGLSREEFRFGENERFNVTRHEGGQLLTVVSKAGSFYLLSVTTGTLVTPDKYVSLEVGNSVIATSRVISAGTLSTAETATAAVVGAAIFLKFASFVNNNMPDSVNGMVGALAGGFLWIFTKLAFFDGWRDRNKTITLPVLSLEEAGQVAPSEFRFLKPASQEVLTRLGVKPVQGMLVASNAEPHLPLVRICSGTPPGSSRQITVGWASGDRVLPAAHYLCANGTFSRPYRDIWFDNDERMLKGRVEGNSIVTINPHNGEPNRGEVEPEIRDYYR